MFRVKESGLPPDISEPADLKKLGYFVNNIGQIRMIEFPEKDYHFHWYNQERHNEVRREAMQVCQRNEVDQRLRALGVERLYLPQLTNIKPDEPHVPILAPPIHVLNNRKRLIVIINDSLQDLGILAYRQLQRDLGINGGSVVNFTKELIKRSRQTDDSCEIFADGASVDDESSVPGLIVMNCGQLVYSHMHKQTMTLRSWSALPRKSLCHDQILIHPEYNRVEGHRTAKEHIKWVFDHVINNKDMVNADTEVYVIAIENGAENLLEILNDSFEEYAPRLTALTLINSYVSDTQINNVALKRYLRDRTRQWKVTSSSNNPEDCIEIPNDDADPPISNVSSKSGADSPVAGYHTNTHISWLEALGSPTSSTSTKVRYDPRIPANDAAHGQPIGSNDSDYDDDLSQAALCPTFADDDNVAGAGECVFTSLKVQNCILSFFESVAQSPVDYRNPRFKITAREPEYGDKAANEMDLETDTGYEPLVPLELSSPEYLQTRDAKEELIRMTAALHNMPPDNEDLEEGRISLEKRIAVAKVELERATQKALAAGALPKGEAQEARSEWKFVGGGPKMDFAGTQVDVELVRAAGLYDTAETKSEE
ncbi:hypothetical protein BU24DRAFT_23349 [Aaosphaeria arxii CBS 175.79]|uniref:Arb2 domain-containing protein n=1 Tax=Aaosphaeria arxii CBS 175.79 TaxID=1450172 RepID=A0A6A5Y9V0_9PLEO|nr:uncharacterized protein BU24DRAFT_23349 [Aaosphaeria arxii CBS 175.79]KAF2021590.1 hypothetical protein BU24DRAFT_23349 [Aaosphaeria arxii CBS 175.79]